MTYQITWEPHGVIVTYSESINSRVLLDCYVEVNKDSRYKHVRYQIINTLNLTTIDITSRDMQLFANLDKSNSVNIPNLKFALVANNKLVERLSHLYGREVGTTSWELARFNNLEEAKDWVSHIEEPAL